MDLGVKIIHKKRIDFILTPDKIYFQTRLQCNYLEPSMSYWSLQQRYIRALIEMGEIDDLNSLAEHCSYKLKWMPTSVRYHV